MAITKRRTAVLLYKDGALKITNNVVDSNWWHYRESFTPSAPTNVEQNTKFTMIVYNRDFHRIGESEHYLFFEELV
jgi:hypothetical protein